MKPQNEFDRERDAYDREVKTHHFIIAWVLSVLGAVALVCAILATMSVAHAAQKTPAECYAMATDVYNIGRMRDAGIPGVEILKRVKAGMIAAYNTGNFYLQTRQEMDDMMELVRRVVASTQTPEELSLNVYHRCVALGFGDNWRKM